MSDGSAERPVVLTTVASELEGRLLVDRLGGAGIHAELEGVYSSGMRTEAPSEVRVLVLERDLEAARRLVEERG